nr:SDR family oxidoreductase [uncultured Acidocella sp.]
MSEHRRAGTALITGASSGIGAVYADRLAARGYDLVLVARDEARLGALAAKLRQRDGVAVKVVKADLLSEAGIGAVEAELATKIDLFVNNAGMARVSALAEMSPQEITDIVQLNVLAAARLAAAAARAFGPRGHGQIVNIASVVALVTERFNPVYNASKAFLLNLSQGMGRELAPLGVHVQAVLPGSTRTEIWARSGMDIAMLPPEMVMEVDDLVDAALLGLNRGESVTIPGLPDAAQFEAYEQARKAMGPNLSKSQPASRYRARAAT